MTTPIPLSQQVAALLNTGTAPAAPVASASPFTAGAAPVANASPFTAANPPEAQAASALQASSPFTAPAAPPVSAPAAASSPFTAGTPATGGFATLPPTAQAAPAGNVSPFAAAPPVSAPAVAASPFVAAAPAPAVAASPFAGFTAPAPAAPAVDPRIAEIPSNIAPNQHALWLQHCDTNGLDHRTGQPKGNAAAVIPQVSSTAAPTDPQATFKALAHQMWTEGRACDASTHPDVKRYYDALCTVNGPPANLQAPAVVEPTARKRRKKKDAQGNDTDEDEDKTYQITITKRAVQEAIGFLTSLAQQMPD